jgi:tetratricopeptide (TPR) repeat protein
MEFFNEHGLYHLAESGLNLILKPDEVEVQELIVTIEQLKGNLERSLTILDRLILKEPDNQSFLLRKGDICFKADKFYECEEAYLKAIQIKPLVWPTNFNIYLRLGYIYLRRKSWPDAKTVLLHASELFKESPFAWLGIGTLFPLALS